MSNSNSDDFEEFEEDHRSDDSSGLALWSHGWEDDDIDDFVEMMRRPVYFLK